MICFCTNINLEAPKISPFQGKSCLNILKFFFHHSSILERARVHKGINCGATFKCESSFTTNQWHIMNISINSAFSAKYGLMEEILHQLLGRLSHYLQGFLHRRCKVQDFFHQPYHVSPSPALPLTVAKRRWRVAKRSKLPRPVTISMKPKCVGICMYLLMF